VKTSRLTEAALITGILVIFAMVGNFVLPFIDFIYPLPALLLAKRQGYKAAIMALTSAGLIIFTILGIQMGLYYMVLYTPMAAIMGYFISKDKKPYMAILAGGATYLISFITLLLIMQAFMGINLVDYIRETFVESLKIQESIFSKFDGMSEQLQATKSMYDEMTNAIVLLLPAIILFSSISMTVVNYIVVEKMGKRLGVKIIPLGDFSYFRLPGNISIGILIILGGTYLITKTNFINSDALSANILFVFQILFFIQGLALVKFLMNKYKASKIIRILLMVIIFLNSTLTLAVTFMGLGDSLFDIRKIKNNSRW